MKQVLSVADVLMNVEYKNLSFYSEYGYNDESEEVHRILINRSDDDWIWVEYLFEGHIVNTTNGVGGDASFYEVDKFEILDVLDSDENSLLRSINAEQMKDIKYKFEDLIVTNIIEG